MKIWAKQARYMRGYICDSLEQARLIWKLEWRGGWYNWKRHKRTFDNRVSDSVLFLDSCLELSVMKIHQSAHTNVQFSVCILFFNNKKIAYYFWVKRKEGTFLNEDSGWAPMIWNISHVSIVKNDILL